MLKACNLSVIYHKLFYFENELKMFLFVLILTVLNLKIKQKNLMFQLLLWVLYRGNVGKIHWNGLAPSWHCLSTICEPVSHAHTCRLYDLGKRAERNRYIGGREFIQEDAFFETKLSYLVRLLQLSWQNMLIISRAFDGCHKIV